MIISRRSVAIWYDNTISIPICGFKTAKVQLLFGERGISRVEPADHGNRVLQPYQEHDRLDRDPDKRRRPIG